MKTLRQVEAAIFQTDCSKYLLDGWNRSQPILTKDEEGHLIDNFFMYGSNYSEGKYYTPSIIFGVYADEPKAAYERQTPESEVKEYLSNEEPIDELEERRAFDRHEELYPEIRECAFKDDCTDEQKAAVKEYVSCLETFSGPVLWKFYQELFPSFFEWANSL